MNMSDVVSHVRSKNGERSSEPRITACQGYSVILSGMMDLEWECPSAGAEGRLAPTGRSAIVERENSADRPSRLCSGKISLSGEIFRHNNSLANYAPAWAALELPRNGREGKNGMPMLNCSAY